MAPPTTIRQGTTGLKRKAPISSRRPNINVTLAKNLPVDDIRKQLKRKLRLNFLPDIWQAHLIQRILQGYDSILCAGTGYGKSLIFEGLAKLAGNGKVVVVISPLKALERDQALQASKKGIHTVVLNEDTESFFEGFRPRPDRSKGLAPNLEVRSCNLPSSYL